MENSNNFDNSATGEFIRLKLNAKGMSDSEILALARHEWYSTLAQLWEATGKPVNQAQLKVYAKQLGDLPMGVLNRVVTEILRDHTYNNVPTIGEIWQKIRNIYGNHCDIEGFYEPMMARTN